MGAEKPPHVVSLDEPETANALGEPTIVSIETALSRAEESDSPTLVIRSAVPEVFCSGINLKSGADERAALSDRLYALYERFIVSPVIVVAEVCGIAVGGGVQLCLAADICMAASKASFRFVGAGHGLAVGAWALPPIVGPQCTAELLLSMRTIGGDEAIELGLAVPYRANLIHQIHATEPDARVRIKSLVRHGLLERLRREREGNFAAWTGSISATSSRYEHNSYAMGQRINIADVGEAVSLLDEAE